MSKQSADAWMKRYEEMGNGVYEYHVSGHFMDGYDEGRKAGLKEALMAVLQDCDIPGDDDVLRGVNWATDQIRALQSVSATSEETS